MLTSFHCRFSEASLLRWLVEIVNEFFFCGESNVEDQKCRVKRNERRDNGLLNMSIRSMVLNGSDSHDCGSAAIGRAY